MLKKLLIFASIGEVAFGLLLFLMPELAARLLVAISISGIAITAGRILGACLIALGAVCWPRRNSQREFSIMLVWSVLAACSLVVAGLAGSAGVLLWPAVVVHGAIALLLWANRPSKSVG